VTGPPPAQALSAIHRRFPDRQHVWAGTVRLWRAELAVRYPPVSPLAEWAAKAGDPRRLGLPASVAAAPVIRRSFAFLDLPTGLHRVPVPPGAFDPWPEAIAEVPAVVLHPAGGDTVPFAGDWRTVPVVRAEAVPVVAVQRDGGIEVFVADDESNPLGQLPAGALVPAPPEAWAAAVLGDGWRWAGEGPLREVAPVVP
jgi:hypothetical protein